MASRRATRQGSATISQDEGRNRRRSHSRSQSRSHDHVSFPALPFASCFSYSPGGRGPVCDEGRSLCARLKSADRVWLPRLAARVWLEAVGHGRFPWALGPRVVLVPVPGSSAVQGSDWVGERLACCLQQLGLAAQVWPVLQRRYAVRKSAYAAAGERPSVREHYASFSAEGAVRDLASMYQAASTGEPFCAPVLRLTLIDDVITRGRTLLAAAARVREVFPLAQIHAFALVRTLASDELLRQVLDPCEGEVCWVSDDARRRP